MLLKSLCVAGVVAGALALPAAAQAAPGQAAGNANMRSGPGTNYPVIATIPRGAPFEILGCQGWCEIQYAGRQGYIAGSLVVASAGQPQQYVQQQYVQPYVYAEEPYDYGYYDEPFDYGPSISFGFGGYGGYHHHHHDGNWGGGGNWSGGGPIWWPHRH